MGGGQGAGNDGARDPSVLLLLYTFIYLLKNLDGPKWILVI